MPKSARPLHPIEQADVELAERVALDDDAPGAKLASRIAELGDQPPLIALCAMVGVTGLIRRDRRMVRTGLRMLAAHAVATAVKGLIKDRVDRTRPAAVLNEDRYKLEQGDSREGVLRSMPSGHSAGLTAVARAVSREYPAAAPAATLGSATIMFLQLPSQNHFLSDVVAGCAIGLASEALVNALMGPTEAEGR